MKICILAAVPPQMADRKALFFFDSTDLNSQLCTCQAGAVPLEPRPQLRDFVFVAFLKWVLFYLWKVILTSRLQYRNIKIPLKCYWNKVSN
jgi:hypothetical protein